MVQLRLVGKAEHDPHSTTLEERHIRNFEQQLHSESVTIKRRSVLYVVYGYGDLPDVGQSEWCRLGNRIYHRCLLIPKSSAKETPYLAGTWRKFLRPIQSACRRGR